MASCVELELLRLAGNHFEKSPLGSSISLLGEPLDRSSGDQAVFHSLRTMQQLWIKENTRSRPGFTDLLATLAAINRSVESVMKISPASILSGYW